MSSWRGTMRPAGADEPASPSTMPAPVASARPPGASAEDAPPTGPRAVICPSGSCSSASSSSKIRSAEATPEMSMFAIPATSPSGALNSREYWMNAVT